MLALVAAVLFGIAFIIHATGTATEAIFSATGLMLVGLTLVALHLAGVGAGRTAWAGRRRR
ncbi:hypothetical protein GCM10027160_05360 [Streptomyces calidiresistens]|uniref:Uncharacterized protein n=1 Tax=Streptomyces calidiresistens TaxID=1485586 RepID=A0A7W3T615_9ACTN|nr:hypothetical protein [Streptomyces calidiresistens]MBB0231612.1 hypothetical protein [Streptomyces calidiresistens]